MKILYKVKLYPFNIFCTFEGVHKRWINIISFIIGVAALIVLIFRISVSAKTINVSEINRLFEGWQHILLLLIAVLLIFVNWGIESIKWHKLSRVVEDVGLVKATKSVLTGLAYGHLLPARSSEFFGKILFFKDENKVSITILHFINSMFQLIVTLVFGILALLSLNPDNKHYQVVLILTSLILLIVVGVVVLKAERIFFLKKYFSELKFQLHNKLKIELLFLSIFRYCIFLIQFYLIFKIFKEQQSFSFFFVSRIALYFLITSVVPMISFIEIAVRAMIGIFVFHALGINDFEITIITSIIWLLNIVLPSIIGFFFIFQKVRKK